MAINNTRAMAGGSSPWDRVDEDTMKTKSTGLMAGAEQVADLLAADRMKHPKRESVSLTDLGADPTLKDPFWRKWDGIMPMGVEGKARYAAHKNFMGPMMPGGASPIGNINPGAMPTTQPSARGTMAMPSAGTAGMPSLPGAGGMMRNARGDLTMAARDALDARTGYRRADPHTMGPNIAGAHPARRNAMGDGTNNPNAFRSGRSMNDPDRIAEQMRRRGDPRFIMQRAAMREGQDFSREMFDRQQGAFDARRAQDFQMGMMQDQQRFDQGMTMFDMETQRRQGEAEADFARRMELDRAQREASRITGTMMLPLPPTTPGGESPGSLPMLMTGDGSMKPMGGGPVMNAQEPRMGTMTLPTGESIVTIDGQPEPGFGVFQTQEMAGPSRPGQTAPTRTTRMDGQPQKVAKTNKVFTDPMTQERMVEIYDETGELDDVVTLEEYRRMRGKGGAAMPGGGAGAAEAAAAAAPRTTAGGNKYTVQRRN